VLSGLFSAVIGAFRRSIQLRYVALTVAFSAVALVAVGGFLSYSIGNGLFHTRVEQLLQESKRAKLDVQNTFNSSGATDVVSLQVLVNAVVPNLEQNLASGSRRVALLRSPNPTTDQFLQSPISSTLVDSDIPSAMRAKVAKTDNRLVYRTVTLNVLGKMEPSVIVGSKITIPIAGQYELYLVYDISDAQATLDFMQSTLAIGGLIMILLLGIVAYFVTGRIVGPVSRAAQVAEELALGALDKRLPERGQDIVATLARSFNQMAQSLETQIGELSKLSKMQQRFVSDVSHELRTPLTTIKLAAEMLEARSGELDEKAKRSLDTLVSQVARFESLLSDLLEISRYDAGAVVAELEPNDLNTVVSLAVAGLEPLAETLGCALEVRGPKGEVVADLDRRRIERVLRNLISNAIEHGSGKPIVIEVGQSKTAVAVTITDFGVGMSRNQMDRVFDRFWRADPARKRTTGGTGLGLAISLEDTHLHHGWLQVTSELGQGTTFRITLPRKNGGIFTESPLPLGQTLSERKSYDRQVIEGYFACRRSGVAISLREVASDSGRPSWPGCNFWFQKRLTVLLAVRAYRRFYSGSNNQRFSVCR
jgi:two-component system sensor histidine kinase MtrB